MLNRWPFTLRRSFEKQPFLPTINPNSILQLGFRDSKDFNRGLCLFSQNCSANNGCHLACDCKVAPIKIGFCDWPNPRAVILFRVCLDSRDASLILSLNSTAQLLVCHDWLRDSRKTSNPKIWDTASQRPVDITWRSNLLFSSNYSRKQSSYPRLNNGISRVFQQQQMCLCLTGATQTAVAHRVPRNLHT